MASLHFAICAALLLLGAANPDGIRRRMHNTRIVGGNVSYIKNIPYIVSLQDSGNHFCGGSILNECYVLTSAECVFGKDPKAVTIRAGSLYFNESGNEYAARSIVIHPKYPGEGLDYNVALIQTKGPIRLGETILPIPYPYEEPEPETPVMIAGWGETEVCGGFQHYVHFAVVRKARMEWCTTVYDNLFNATDRMICTYGDGSGACRGDNGGPVVRNNELVGVISHSVGCGMYPDIHANVANREILDFVVTNANGEC